MTGERGPNEVKFWYDGWSLQGEVHIPPEYVRLNPGDRFKTRRVKQLAAERGLTIYTRTTKNLEQFSRAVAYFVPPNVMAAVEEEALATHERRERARLAAAAAREKAHAREVAKVVGLIRRQYPRMPADEARQVAVRIIKVASVRSRRISAFVLAKKIELAVRAHAILHHTGYDDLLIDGWGKEDARRLVAAQVDAVVEGWLREQPEDQ